jgi:hypothetical protein
MFTRAGSESTAVVARAESLFATVTRSPPSVAVEEYDKLDLYAHKITLHTSADARTALALFDAFLAVASSGWAFLPFDEDATLREAGWDHRRTDEVFLDPAIHGVFTGVYNDDS